MIKKLVVGDLETNCYILFSDDSALVIDPGDEPEKIVEFLTKNKLNPIAIINTHGHSDHIGGNRYIKEKFNIPIYIHYSDAPLLKEPALNFSIFTGGFIKSPPADKLLAENDIITCGKIQLKVIHTPGHTRGSISLLGDGYIFTGDTLFCGSVGRWDLYGGNERLLMESVKRLVKLPPQIRILPGHGPECSIAGELEHNPYCKWTNI